MDQSVVTEDEVLYITWLPITPKFELISDLVTICGKLTVAWARRRIKVPSNKSYPQLGLDHAFLSEHAALDGITSVGPICLWLRITENDSF